jgi:hypothetical protein
MNSDTNQVGGYRVVVNYDEYGDRWEQCVRVPTYISLCNVRRESYPVKWVLDAATSVFGKQEKTENEHHRE